MMNCLASIAPNGRQRHFLKEKIQTSCYPQEGKSSEYRVDEIFFWESDKISTKNVRGNYQIIAKSSKNSLDGALCTHSVHNHQV